MLLYFKIKNSRSFSETATLSMIADDTIDRLPQNIINANSKHILKTAVIYGANASGKSNLLKAFADGCIIVQNGISLERKQSTKNNTLYLPNKNHETNKSLPTCYTYGLLIDDIRYEYYFSNDASRIVEEKLLCYEEGKKYPTTLFKRIYLENKSENKYRSNSVL